MWQENCTYKLVIAHKRLPSQRNFTKSFSFLFNKGPHQFNEPWNKASRGVVCYWFQFPSDQIEYGAKTNSNDRTHETDDIIRHTEVWSWKRYQ